MDSTGDSVFQCCAEINLCLEIGDEQKEEEFLAERQQ